VGNIKIYTGTHLHINWDRYQQGDEIRFDGIGASVGGRFGSFWGLGWSNKSEEG